MKWCFNQDLDKDHSIVASANAPCQAEKTLMDWWVIIPTYIITTTIKGWPMSRRRTDRCQSTQIEAHCKIHQEKYLVLREHMSLGASGAPQPFDLRSNVQGQSSHILQKGPKESGNYG